MKRISREDIYELQQLADDIRSALVEYSELRDQATADIDKIVADMNEKRQRAWEIIDAAATDADSYFEERSEKWQDGEKGQVYGEWRDELQRVAGEIEEEIEAPELPELEEPGWVGEIADTPWSEVPE